MDYHIQRGDQKFGPYTLTELQEYFQSGRILAGDLAQSEGMTDWVPVSQILGNIPIPQVGAPASAAPPPETVPLPPNLPWVVLLLIFIVGQFPVLSILLSLFIFAWSFVIANWARKLINNNRPLVLVAMYPAGLIAGVLTMAFATASHNSGVMALGGIFILAGLLIYVYGIFKIRDAMEEYYNTRENIALTMSGVMTFFFSLIYIQYHINRIAKWKKTGILP